RGGRRPERRRRGAAAARAGARGRRPPAHERAGTARDGLPQRPEDPQLARSPGAGLTKFETSVRIERPLEEVFAYLSDPLTFPRWNSAVLAVRRTQGRESEVGSTYSMERELPRGRVQNDLEIFARERPTEFGIRT